MEPSHYEEVPKSVLEQIVTSRAKKGSLIIKSPKSKSYTIIKAFNVGSKSIFGILDKTIGYLKSSDISILDKTSTGNTYTKKNVEDVFVVTRLTDITQEEKVDNIKESNNDDDAKESPKESTKENTKEIKKENKTENKKEKKEEVKQEKQLTMSDFFEEFKI